MAKTMETGGCGPTKVGETRHIYLDAAKKGRRDLAWFLALRLEEALEKTVACFRDKE